MKAVVYDSGVLIAADRSQREIWAEHRVRLEAGLVPLVPATVVAQASRSPKQVQLQRLLRGCEIVPFQGTAAHAVGALLGKARTSDVVDASVVELAMRKQADIITGDRQDLQHLLSVARARVEILDL